MNKRRFLAFTSSLLVSAALLNGCGSKNEEKNILDKNNPVTITVWHYYNGIQQTNFDKSVSEFNETVGQEKGIIVEAYSKNSISELAESVTASIKKDAGSEEAPDIFATYAETAFKLDKLGALADLKQYFTDEEISQYVPGYIDEGRFSGDDSIKIFPTAKSTEIMMLNLTDWEKFAESENISRDSLKTWEGVAETAEKYYAYTDALTPDIENDGKAFFGRDSVANYMNVGAMQLGVPFIEPGEGNTVKINVDKTVVKRLWENYYVPFVKGYYAADSRYRSDDAKTGKIIAFTCSTTGVTYCPSEVTINDDYSYPIENVVLPVPNFEGTDPYIVQQGAGMSVIKSDEKREYASVIFLKWFTEEERNIEFSINSGYLPVKKDANDFEKIMEVNNKLEKGMSDIMLSSLSLAIDEIKSYTLYTAVPFEKSEELRKYLENSIQDTAYTDYSEISERIKNGESRDKVIGEYTSDAAFEKWFGEFKTNLDEIVK